ncbi:EF-hand domain-containing protein [Pseudomonas xanthosomatis]|uniref:EF-hand domain-containing protein n=1 Tax=Pseudomonas xanthosomatis TaxID=2842356 RepID=UPI003511872E
MPSHTRRLSAGLLLGLLCSQANADSIDEIFSAQDSNGDGAISVQEARAAAPAIFRSIDRNGNSSLDVDEIAAHIAAEAGPGTVFPAQVLASVAQKTLQYWDANGDGKVTEQEYTEAAVTLLLMADSDGDRLVTREELQRFRGEGPAQ